MAEIDVGAVDEDKFFAVAESIRLHVMAITGHQST